jgi:obg-like ATPase 1
MNFFFVQYIGAFDDPDVTHVDGEVNPVRDLDTISEELRLKDEETLAKNLEKLEKLVVRGNDKKLKPEYVSIIIFSKKTVNFINI